MNARDPWADFAAVFAEELLAASVLTPKQMDAMAEEYAKEQIATAQSEQAMAANLKEYSRG